MKWRLAFPVLALCLLLLLLRSQFQGDPREVSVCAILVPNNGLSEKPPAAIAAVSTMPPLPPSSSVCIAR